MKGPPQRQRYNAKARQSSVGSSSHKKRRNHVSKSASQQNADPTAQGHDQLDSNRNVIDPTSKEEQQLRVRETQRRELLAASHLDAKQKLSSKKRKRLDAYIASRLKKEARAELLEELARTTAEVRQGRQHFISARTLGTGKGMSVCETIEGKLKQDELEDFTEEEEFQNSTGQEDWHHLPAQVDERPTGEMLDDPERRQRILKAAALFSTPTGTAGPLAKPPVGSALAGGSFGLGSALARSTDGQPVVPMMRKRKRKGPSQRERRRLRQLSTKEDSSGSDSSFDSSDSSENKSKSGPEDQDKVIDEAGRKSSFAGCSRSQDDVDRHASQQILSFEPFDSGEPDSSNRETDSDEEIVLMEAMRRRGLAQESEDDEESQDGPPRAEPLLRLQDVSDRDTEREEERGLLEVMRRRGLTLPTKDEDSEEELAEAHLSAAADDSQQVSKELGLVQDRYLGSKAKSLPREGFASEDEAREGGTPTEGFHVEQRPNYAKAGGPSIDSNHLDDHTGNANENFGVDGNDDKDEDEAEDIKDAHSNTNASDQEAAARRRGILRTGRSSGFKDWARAALGFGGSSGEANGAGQPMDRTEKGVPLDPVAGFSVKVSEMGPSDGIVRGPLGEREDSPTSTSAFAAKFYEEVASSKAVRNVRVQRSPEVAESRLRLPVVQEEERVVKAILENEVTIICGETGSGKTTQVAQMLFERGFGSPGSDNPGLVGITQPRRVAAVSTARRVAEELNLGPNRISHQIRYDGTVSPQTSLKFMTDGVLLRELASDFLLTKYSVVIVDEAHERSVNTDVLIGMLSRIVRLRASRWMQDKATSRPLRLVIMSATLRVADFFENATLFAKPPPLINIEARQYPVTIHFNRRTTHDYIQEAVTKASKIHTRLPSGGILIFMTGEQEIKTVCRDLQAKFGKRAVEKQQQRKSQQHQQWQKRQVRRCSADDDKSTVVEICVRPGKEDVEPEDITLGAVSEKDTEIADDVKVPIDLLGNIGSAGWDSKALDTDTEDEDADGDDRIGVSIEGVEADHPMHILPLYSLLTSEKQLRVFEDPPEGSRLVVVATNVAETSLTIPNVRYVIDCGRAKERKYDKSSGISSFKVDWISKASAAQRAGRAGRTGPGHCYRLYSSNVFEEYFNEFAEAEIRRTSVESLVLQMKSMSIDNVVHFPFPSPPDRGDIAKAERVLTRLGALSLDKEKKTKRSIAKITELGRAMALFPLNPRFAKMLVQGQQHGCLPYVIALVAALSVGDLFVREEAAAEQNEDATEGDEKRLTAMELGHLSSDVLREKEQRKMKRLRKFETLERFDSLSGPGISDAFRVLAVVGAHEFAGDSVEFCKENFLRPKAMKELQQLRNQLASLVLSTLTPSAETAAIVAMLSSPKLPPPNATQLKVIRQLIACAYIDQVAVRADLVPEASHSIPELVQMSAKGQLAGQRWRTSKQVPFLAMRVREDAAYIHPSSALFEHAPPDWCVFSEIVRSSSKTRRVKEDDDPDQDHEQRGRVYLKGLTKINPEWIAKLGKDMCSFSKPVPLDGKAARDSLADSIRALKREGTVHRPREQQVLVTPTYGTGPACEPSERAGHLGWELPPIKAVRKWVGGSQGWEVDL